VPTRLVQDGHVSRAVMVRRRGAAASGRVSPRGFKMSSKMNILIKEQIGIISDFRRCANEVFSLLDVTQR